MKIYLATSSEHKREEWNIVFDMANENKSLFPDEKEEIELVLPPEGIDLNTPEEGSTLFENAHEKALKAYKQLFDNQIILPGEFVLADDSGLFVTAFGGPGVASKRGKCAGPENILKAFDNFYSASRSAHMITVACLMSFKGDFLHYSCNMHGFINDKMSDKDGYCYDKIFVPYNIYSASGMRIQNEYGCLAELTEKERYRAGPRYQIAVEILSSYKDFKGVI